MHFNLIRSLVPNARILENRVIVPTTPIKNMNDGAKLSYLGQMLAQLGHRIPRDPIMLPSELNILTASFTRKCFHKIIDTDLTIDLIMTAPSQEDKIGRLLAAHNHTCTFHNFPPTTTLKS